MIHYQPIVSIEPERDVLRCLPVSKSILEDLLSFQKSFGIGAYENGLFVGSVWFYLINDPEIGNPYGGDWTGLVLGSASYNEIISIVNPQDYPVLCLRCFHVGRTKETELADRNDESYYNKGIGTGLLLSAIHWASDNNYSSIISETGIDSFIEYNNWAGNLPLKSYLKNGFTATRYINAKERIPGHLLSEMAKYDCDRFQMAYVKRNIYKKQI